jgi:hypothetical protein
VRASAFVACAVVVILLLPACGGDDNTVAATLQEFAVSADPSSVATGSVTFDVSNDGPDDVHEFVVIATDLGPAELPVDEDGAVDEGGEGIEVVDEIEEIPVGESRSLTVDLEAGNYVLICNILQEEPNGTLEAHYSEGMRTGFTVE